jgi:hypothetical protein
MSNTYNFKNTEQITNVISDENNIVSFINDLSIKEFCTNPENIQQCLNRELAPFGIETKLSPDGSTLYVDSESKSRIVQFLSGNERIPVLEPGRVERLQEIAEVIQEKKILMIWKLNSVKRCYYLAKQHTFNGINFYHALNIKNTAASAAALSTTGAATLTLSSTIAISFTGAMFLSLVESYLPAGNIKTVVKGAKVIIAIPIGITEVVTNGIIGTLEKLVMHEPLPINVTDVYGFSDGPKIEDVKGIRDKVTDFLLTFARKVEEKDSSI